MSHNLNFNEALGRHSFVSLKEKPWHSLGIVVQDAMTSHDAIHLAGLDYEVGLGKMVLLVETKDTTDIIRDKQFYKGVDVTDHFATYRKDTLDYFGVVGNKYEVVQNTEAFDFFDEIVGKKEAIFETAGALGKGETIFVTAKLPSYIKIGTSDIIEKYLLFTSSHDGSGTVRAMFTPVRVVCNNTLNMALNNCTNKINLKHTKSVHSRIQEGAKLMDLVNQNTERLQDVLNTLAKTPIDKETVAKFVLDLYLTYEELVLLERADYKFESVDEISTRKKNIVKEVHNTIESGIGQDTFRGTAYWLLNGITSYYGNTKEYSDKEDRFNNIITGTANSKTQEAFNKLLTFI